MSEQKIDQRILLISFDINSSNEENNNNENNNYENLPENPIRIMDEFFANHQMSNLEKNEIKSSEIKYKFDVNFEESFPFQIIVINNLSFIHEIILDAEGYLIFINLEDEKTEEKLELLTKYITDNCSAEEKNIYFVGLYKNKILPSLNKENLENFFKDNNLNYEYYEIKYNMNDNNNKTHNCLYESINRKKTFQNKIEQEFNLQEIIEKIIVNSYETKMSVVYVPKKKKFMKKVDKNESDSDSFCNIY